MANRLEDNGIHRDTGVFRNDRIVSVARRWFRRQERVVLFAMLGAVIVVWGAAVAFTLSERGFALERAESQLTITVTTLADFNELAERAMGEAVLRASDQRTAAIWRALLQYPTARIWVDTEGEPLTGQPPEGPLDDAIVVSEVRDGFTVHAALPIEDALADWRRGAVQRAAAMAAASVAFLLLTFYLTRTLQQRAAAEQDAAAADQRAAQLAAYKAELEQTVASRTLDLNRANEQLGKELVERRAAQRELQQHDALLHAVAKGAARLLGSHSDEEATEGVLELIGQTVGVNRVQLTRIDTDQGGRLKSSLKHEWCAPGVTSLLDNPALQNLDLAAAFPRGMTELLLGRPVTSFIEEVASGHRKLFEDHGMRSMLKIPVLQEGKLWGSMDFFDAHAERRAWSWAETDTLQTLAGLVGAAITRARYVKELADANMIVQNSPTILYRVKGEPPFPLIYISHNIRKFGHDAQQLVGNLDWAGVLMGAEDGARVSEAMGRALDRDAQGAAIEFRLRTGDGRFRWVENRYTPVRDRHGRLVEVEGIIIDITERKAAEDKIALLARTDALTGLANRATFIERLRQAFAAARRGATPFAIMYLDLDHFKQINDTLGHATGDALLREVAERLKGCARETDVIARLGGDEFAVLQTDMNEPANAGTLAAGMMAALTRPYQLEGNELHMTASIGICPYATSSASPEAMLSQADLALYRSKEEGRNRYRFHSDDLDDQVFERVTLAEELKRALERNELELYYQPQVELASGKIVGMEALMRWHHPERGLLRAKEFIAVAEKTGTIIALGQWALDQACRQVRLWRDQGVKPVVMTLNLSLAQLKSSRELVRDVLAALERWRLKPSDISFDVTEATLAQATLMHNEVLSELRKLGIRIAIDDFGSEYSSFDYLRTYDVNHLKMAQSFIDAARTDPERAATVRAIINLARELGVTVVTEGVETEEQLDLSTATSTIAQGFYFSEALVADEACELLRRGSIDAPPALNSAVSRQAAAASGDDAKEQGATPPLRGTVPKAQEAKK